VGLIAKLQQENAELRARVEHLEKAFDGLHQYVLTIMPQREMEAQEKRVLYSNLKTLYRR
jgi:hypothetical protein